MFKVLLIWGELAGLGGLADLGEMILIPRSYGFFHLTSIKKFVILLELDCFDLTVFNDAPKGL